MTQTSLRDTGTQLSRVLRGASRLPSNVLQAKRFWLGPAAAAALAVVVGLWTLASVENSLKQNLTGQLEKLRDANVNALRIWLEEQLATVTVVASSEPLSRAVAALVDVPQGDDPTAIKVALLKAPELGQLRELLAEWDEHHTSDGFAVVSRDGRVLATQNDLLIGDATMIAPLLPRLEPLLADGDPMILMPFKSLVAIPDADGVPRAGQPVMYSLAPVRDDSDNIIAAFGLRLRADKEFTNLLQSSGPGESGETYAFNADGKMISQSRFEPELRQLGLLSDDAWESSILNVELRDPGVDLTQGSRPVGRRNELPKTRMAVAAIEGSEGSDVDGYRDYRGVPVVGAWAWLPEYGIGVATEVDKTEAFQPLLALRRAVWLVTALLLLFSLGMLAFAVYASRLDLKARRAALDAKQLGQYVLEEKIGAGGMGVVYRARHHMLQRPTALKLLDVEQTNERAIARFEREVQFTSQLTHPNTIMIYDYGRTPEGVFYYVMEFLEGINLEDLVIRFGALSEGRVIHILRQLCGSLSEAHQRGLIHRDVKPANVMLTRCGGMVDFVKLLDFGLVKPHHEVRQVTQDGAVTGTPMFMSPEAIQNGELDARSDLYAVGAVAYFLMTSTNVFLGENIVELCRKQVHEAPQPPSERLERPVDPELEKLILDCLAKSPADRPESAEAILERLDRCREAHTWTPSVARQWWSRYLDDTVSGQTTVVAPTADTNRDLQETMEHPADTAPNDRE